MINTRRILWPIGGGLVGARWEREHALRIRLWYGLVMVGLGVGMLLWVIG